MAGPVVPVVMRARVLMPPMVVRVVTVARRGPRAMVRSARLVWPVRRRRVPVSMVVSVVRAVVVAMVVLVVSGVRRPIRAPRARPERKVMPPRVAGVVPAVRAGRVLTLRV